MGVDLDGLDVCDLPVERVRARIGYAQQDAFLFSTTVAENIGYSRRRATRERILDAAFGTFARRGYRDTAMDEIASAKSTPTGGAASCMRVGCPNNVIIPALPLR